MLKAGTIIRHNLSLLFKGWFKNACHMSIKTMSFIRARSNIGHWYIDWFEGNSATWFNNYIDTF